MCCVALMVAGAAGAVGLSPGAEKRPPQVTVTATTTIPAVSPTPAGPAAGPAADSASLAAGLIQPTDMGGYYHSSPSALSLLLDSDPCLAALQPSPAQSGRAAEGLVTNYPDSVPEITEVVASYSGDRPTAVYDSTVAAINACANFAFDFNGTAVSGPLSSESLTTSADSGTAWQVPFQFKGQACVLQMALVRQGQNIMFLGWADTAAPSPAIMGGFASTVTAAIGKEA